MRRFALPLISLALFSTFAVTGAQPALAKNAEPATAQKPDAPAAKPLLPDAFAGWATPEPLKTLADAGQADGANAAALKEYGFVDGAVATYKRSGDTLTGRALRFSDASGAYGAYSFYRQNGWPREDNGSGATSDPPTGCFSG